MRKFLVAIVLVCLMVSVASAVPVSVNSTNFPDPVFLNYVSMSVDINPHDGWLSDEEIARKISIDLRGKGIQSLKGIEYFSALTLLECSWNELTTLDVGKNTALTTLYCGKNKLTNLTLGDNKALTLLNCDNNQLQKIDVSKNTSLSHLWCFCNKLTQLDVSKNTDLTELWCSGNNLTTLALSSNKKLKTLYCWNNELKYLNISDNKDLESLNCSVNELSELNVRENRYLVFLDCYGNNLTELDVSYNGDLDFLNCEANLLTMLNVRNNEKLETLHAWSNLLTTLDLSNNTKLQSVRIQENQLTAFDVNPNLSCDYLLFTQKINTLKLTEHAGGEYPYSINFSDYMSTSQITNIMRDYVKGVDKDGNTIETSYLDGVAYFASKPERVEYRYFAGLNRKGNSWKRNEMRVIIGFEDGHLTKSLNNHVYRIFTRAKSWNIAEKYCRSLGGHLASINTDDEKELIQELISEAGRDGNMSTAYLGGRRVDGIWGWTQEDEKFRQDIADNITMLFPESIYTPSDYLALTASGDFVNVHDHVLIGNFICEWEPVNVELEKYSEEYQRYLDNPSAYSDNEGLCGDIPDATNYSHFINPPELEGGIEDLPEVHDPRDSGIMSPVKNQTPYNTCWAFASLGALEASYVAQGFGNEAPDLSELYQAWFAYKDPRPGYSNPVDPTKKILNQKGCDDLSIEFLARVGTAYEADLPYTDNEDNVEGLINGKLPEDYTHPIRLKAAYKLGPILKGNIDNRNFIKNLILQYGGVRIGYNRNGEYENGAAYYNPENTGGGHAVLVVGWNDNYPKENFKTHPSRNGAWLIKNSWGEGVGDKGYFWFSYDQEIYSSAVYIAADDTINKIHGYNVTAAIDAISYHWSANIFKADADEVINEVAVFANNTNVNCEIYINKFGIEQPVKPGTPQAAVASVNIPYVGFHTIALNNPVEIEAGKHFSVIVKFTHEDPEVTHFTKAEKVVGMTNSSQVRTANITDAGISYFAEAETIPTSADWIDGGNLSYERDDEGREIGVPLNACIKVFSVENTPPKISSSPMPSGNVGQDYSYRFTASGVRPITWTVTGLPDGLSCNDGKITGVPSKADKYTINVTAENRKGADTKTLELEISGTNSGGGGSGGGCNSFGLIYGLLALAIIFRIRRK